VARAVLLVLVAALAGQVAGCDRAPASWPWSAVGRVLRDGQGPCSGVLVAPTVVLTVGHCVADRRGWRATPDRLSFVLGRLSYGVAAVRLPAESPFDAGGAIRDLRHDWALLALDRPAEVAPVPYGGPQAARLAFVLDQPLVRVGWADAGLGLFTRRRDEDCAVRHLDPEATLLVYRCADAHGGGRSGSALLLRAGEGWLVAGVQSALREPGDVPLAIAVAPDGRDLGGRTAMDATP
jgi:hypothetical protein